MMTFHAYFRRYNNGENRISTMQSLSAEDFIEAANKAALMVRAMEGADPDSRYDIVSMEATGYRGVKCDGARMFETSAELQARIEEQQK